MYNSAISGLPYYLESRYNLVHLIDQDSEVIWGLSSLGELRAYAQITFCCYTLINEVQGLCPTSHTFHINIK